MNRDEKWDGIDAIYLHEQFLNEIEWKRRVLNVPNVWYGKADYLCWEKLWK